MAQERGLPVSIHCRDAWADLLGILRQEWRKSDLGGILHSFTGAPEHASECVAQGFLISFSGIVTFKNADRLRDAARGVPLDVILVETDAPFLAPMPHRGTRNEPAFVVDVARSLASTLNVPFEEFARQTTSNLRRLLRFENRDL
jgi:TatD DNase family protein